MRLPKVAPFRVLEWFVIANLAFLGLDILVAHQENAFRERMEWVPIAFSAAAPIFLLPGAFHVGPARVTRKVDLVVGALAILVGVAGMVFHLESAFFVDTTLRSLVYSAPFIAPLAYVGVGLLLVLLRVEARDSPEMAEWALLLALGGFLGNFVLSLLDHAQNSFFSWAEWMPVVAAAFGCGFLAVALIAGEGPILRVTLGVCALEALVGAIGFALHLRADLRRPSPTVMDRFVHGAPAFAPLLFTNLAVLAAVAIWMRLRAPIALTSGELASDT